MKLAILYQAAEPPVVDGIRKPMKPGGYSDSGADIAFCLRNSGIDVVTPCDEPDIYNDKDWVFPDTKEGIREALNAGAEVFWLNTVLYKGHPIDDFDGIYIVGQRTSDTAEFDDKYTINAKLRNESFPVVSEEIVDLENNKYSGKYPCIIKPIRGRGSQGVVKCGNDEEFKEVLKKEIAEEIYGTRMIAGEFLSGNEITISVLPGGRSLPVVERFNHENGIAPYNGKVPVVENSRAVLNNTSQLDRIVKACEEAVKKHDLKGLVRVDCRADESGEYKMFDFNLKPNMTGAVRPHRMNQNSLTMIAAEAIGWNYADLLKAMYDTRWKK